MTAIILYYVGIMAFLFDLILGLPPFISGYHVVYVFLFLIPWSALTCLSRPAMTSIMEKFVLTRKYAQYMDADNYYIKSNFKRATIAICLLYLVRIGNLCYF